MHLEQLDKVIENLKLNDDVDAVFMTGSLGVGESKSYSDIDLVIILKENKNNLYSLYRWIGGIFADIFFFELADLRRLEKSNGKYENSTDGILAHWLKKSDIKFDKSGLLTRLKVEICNHEESLLSNVSEDTLWQKINYNYVTNTRYFESKDPLYLKALELRLLYSVIEVLCGFLAFRNVPWRGEKEAVKYLEKDHPEFYSLFDDYTKASELNNRFKLYSQMVNLVFTDEYKKWTEESEIILRKDFSVAHENDIASKYVDSLFI